MNTYNTTKNVELAFIPCPGLSHFVPTVESAKHLLECDPRVSITVLIMKLHTDPALEKYKQTLISSSRLRFLTLPAAPDSSTSALPFKAIDGQAAHVKAAISDLIESPGSRLAGLVLDVLTTSFLDIADEFGLPSYVFSVTSASSLGLMFHLTSSTSCNTGDLENLANNENEQLSVPCFLNPVPKKVLPDPFLGEGPEPDTIIGFLKRISEAKGVLMNTCGAATLGLFLHLQGLADHENRDLAAEFAPDSDSAVSIPTYADPVPAKVWPNLIFEEDSVFLTFARRFRETKGIIVNTFLELEPRAIDALSGDRSLPPVFPVGPIIEAQEVAPDDGTIEWLDGQPDSSVVFLCFGSRGCFDRDQVVEIARALESSGARFLWSLRKPPPKEKLEFPGEYENLSEVLPEGFLDRTVGSGKVIGWAPQLAILSHRAVGGFVSHCGWNSTLESVRCGVPMAAWPLAAEQQANAFQLVKELGLAVEIKMDYRRDSDVIVPAEKIEKAVRELMDPRNECRAKVKTLSEKSRVIVKEGGSSFDYLGSFIDKVLDNV